MIDGERLKPSGRYGVPTEEELADESRVVWDTFESYKNGQYVEPKYMAYSDYSGSLVERSNVEEFSEQFAELEGQEWWERYGDHGSRGVVVRRDADARVPEIGEFFEALDSYPLANEERHSELEMNQRQEDWDSYGRGDFERWLAEDEFGLESRRSDDNVASIVLVPFLRGTLAEIYPGFDPIFDELKDEVIVSLTGGLEPWEDFVSSLNSEAVDSLWGELVHTGSGDAEEIEQHHTNFSFDRVFTDYYEGGQKGAGIAEVLRFTQQPMTKNGDGAAWKTFEAWVLNLEENGIGPEHRVRVVLDYLLENGGVWDAQAEKYLRQQKLGRYA